MDKTYYNPDDLKKFGNVTEHASHIGHKFFEYYTEVFKPGALSGKEKSLIALAVAHAVQCPYCIEAYSKDALEKGASPDQMMEAVHVTVAIRGGSSLVHGVQMQNHIKKLSM